MSISYIARLVLGVPDHELSSDTVEDIRNGTYDDYDCYGDPVVCGISLRNAYDYTEVDLDVLSNLDDKIREFEETFNIKPSLYIVLDWY